MKSIPLCIILFSFMMFSWAYSTCNQNVVPVFPTDLCAVGTSLELLNTEEGPLAYVEVCMGINMVISGEDTIFECSEYAVGSCIQDVFYYFGCMETADGTGGGPQEPPPFIPFPSDPCDGNYFTLIFEYEYYSQLGKNLTIPSQHQFINATQFNQLYPNSNFSFLELTRTDDVNNNTGSHYPCAIIDYRLVPLLEEIRACYGSSIYITGGYRPPFHHYDHKGFTSLSRHMYGAAADLRSNNSCSQWRELALCAHSKGLWVEPYNLSTKDHVHVQVGTAPNSIQNLSQGFEAVCGSFYEEQ